MHLMAVRWRIESVGEVEQGYEETERRLVLKDIFNVLNETEKVLFIIYLKKI